MCCIFCQIKTVFILLDDIFTEWGLRAIGHGGEVDGHSAVIAFFPELRRGVVVLCNQGGDVAEQLVRPLMGLVLGPCADSVDRAGR